MASAFATMDGYALYALAAEAGQRRVYVMI
jgi:hypothetical protein